MRWHRIASAVALCTLAFRAGALSVPPLRAAAREHAPAALPTGAGAVAGRAGLHCRHTACSARLWVRGGLAAMKLRGGGPAGGAGAGELFDALLQADDRVGFLADTYLRGDAATREQAVSYTTLLMSEDGFLDNMTPLQLLQLCITAPDLVRACAQSLPAEANAAGEAAPGALEELLAGLPEAIDALSLRALLKNSNSTMTR